jgi:hypothetical protein
MLSEHMISPSLNRTALLLLLTLLAITPSLRAAETATNLNALLQEIQTAPGAAKFETHARRILEMARRQPQDPGRVDALLWVVVNDADGSEWVGHALALLQSDHALSPKLGLVFRPLADLPPTVTVEKLLRAIAEKNPDASLQTEALFYLARTLNHQYQLWVKWGESKEAVDREALELVNGKDLIAKIKSANPEKLSAEAEAFYEKFIAAAAGGKAGRRSPIELAKRELYDLRYLSVGKVAPATEGEDVEGQKLKLSDYRGKVTAIVFWGDW